MCRTLRFATQRTWCQMTRSQRVHRIRRVQTQLLSFSGLLSLFNDLFAGCGVHSAQTCGSNHLGWICRQRSRPGDGWCDWRNTRFAPKDPQCIDPMTVMQKLDKYGPNDGAYNRVNLCTCPYSVIVPACEMFAGAWRRGAELFQSQSLAELISLYILFHSYSNSLLLFIQLIFLTGHSYSFFTFAAGRWGIRSASSTSSASLLAGIPSRRLRDVIGVTWSWLQKRRIQMKHFD